MVLNNNNNNNNNNKPCKVIPFNKPPRKFCDVDECILSRLISTSDTIYIFYILNEEAQTFADEIADFFLNKMGCPEVEFNHVDGDINRIPNGFTIEKNCVGRFVISIGLNHGSREPNVISKKI